MFRLFAAILATVSAVVFIMANTHHVRISFVVGSPVQIRLIFLLMITFVAGAVASGFLTMISKLRFHWHVTRQVRRGAEPAGDPGLDDDLVADWAGK